MAVIPEILTKQDIAKLLAVSPRQVQRWISARKLKASRLGHRTVRIRRRDFERFMERH